MRDSIENISQLQKKLNELQLENQLLKNILDRAGLSYHGAHMSSIWFSLMVSSGMNKLNT